MKRGLLSLLIGLLVGGGLGLYLGWFVYPLELVDVAPADLTADYQADYLQLVATTYAADNDLAAARRRIGTLGRDDWRGYVLAQTVDAVLAAPAASETNHLIGLARDLGLESPALQPAVVPTPTEATADE